MLKFQIFLASFQFGALMEAEGIAMRPGPRPVVTPGVLPTLRRAILSMQLVVVRYAGPRTEEPATRILRPYGLLYGGRGWLVAPAGDAVMAARPDCLR